MNAVNLFEPYNINNLSLKNRFVRSATWDCAAADDGAVTDISLNIYKALGEGGTGLIVTGFAYVSAAGCAAKGQYGVHNDSMIPGLRKMAETVHRAGAKIALQIHHGGISAVNEAPAPAVSVVRYIRKLHREMTSEEIEAIINDFAAAAARAKAAGFDAVQLHGAHGYLISQFISPLMNRRTDKWGGSLENRARFPVEVIKKVRQAVGPDYPVMIKLGIRDENEQGLKLADGIKTAEWMIEAGIDAIEVSAGVGGSAIPIARPGDPEIAVFRDRAAALKKAVNIPVILVGGIRSPEAAQDIVNSGDADMISMCRPFIREPGLIKRWESGDTSPAKCISCGLCINFGREDQRLLECGQNRLHKERAIA